MSSLQAGYADMYEPNKNVIVFTILGVFGIVILLVLSTFLSCCVKTPCCWWTTWLFFVLFSLIYWILFVVFSPITIGTSDSCASFPIRGDQQLLDRLVVVMPENISVSIDELGRNCLFDPTALDNEGFFPLIHLLDTEYVVNDPRTLFSSLSSEGNVGALQATIANLMPWADLEANATYLSTQVEYLNSSALGASDEEIDSYFTRIYSESGTLYSRTTINTYAPPTSSLGEELKVNVTRLIEIERASGVAVADAGSLVAAVESTITVLHSLQSNISFLNTVLLTIGSEAESRTLDLFRCDDIGLSYENVVASFCTSFVGAVEIVWVALWLTPMVFIVMLFIVGKGRKRLQRTEKYEKKGKASSNYKSAKGKKWSGEAPPPPPLQRQISHVDASKRKPTGAAALMQEVSHAEARVRQKDRTHSRAGPPPSAPPPVNPHYEYDEDVENGYNF
eukprot:CAMPEP_0113875156 /NCGR_PEP_ID=MMETSP0780_2-20120614/4777_1 /TAXON_ID=652834 /ORGANISM="Palpitomonas bilix" /LENGTH=449 /DNA_ID=CAMNT_0000861097 /DNA_START=1042 /DNA_END=2391 /DNA_ORIENTATION=+ /assembly_acc=CAM_ASM_000599